MNTTAHWDDVLARLDNYRAVLLGLVADELTYTIPLLAVPPTAAEPAAHHQRQMLATVKRLHDGVQAARLSEELLTHEFVWASQVLPRWGITSEHIKEMIDCYVRTAASLGSWEPAAKVELEELRLYLHGVVKKSFVSSFLPAEQAKMKKDEKHTKVE